MIAFSFAYNINVNNNPLMFLLNTKCKSSHGGNKHNDDENGNNVFIVVYSSKDAKKL